MKIYKAENSEQKYKSLIIVRSTNGEKINCLKFTISKDCKRSYKALVFWYDGAIKKHTYYKNPLICRDVAKECWIKK